MKKHPRLLLILTIMALALSGSGCRTATTADGEPCYGLSGSEKEELVDLARESLLRPNKILSEEETLRIRDGAPEIDIRYNGDKSGKAKVTWDLPTRKISVIFLDSLVEDDSRRRIMEVTPKQNGVIIDRSAAPTASPSAKKSPAGTFRRSGGARRRN